MNDLKLKKAVISQVDILIFTALQEEFDAVKGYIKGELLETEKSNSQYIFSEIENPNYKKHLTIGITCFNAMGNVEANAFTTRIIEELKPRITIMFGLAGSMKKNVEIGTILVSEEIFYYESTKELDNGTDSRPKVIPSDSYLLNEVRNFSNRKRGEFQSRENINVVFGPLAVGEKVIASENYKQKLLEMNSKLIGIDMESYGVCYAAYSEPSNPRFIAIRTVCDNADKNKGDNFRSTALEKGTKFLYSFIKCGKPIIKGFESTLKTDILAIHHISQNRRTIIEEQVKSCYPKINNVEVTMFSIDQTEFYKNGILTNPESALIRQKEKINKINDLLETTQYSQIGYFSLAHIPLVFHLANQLYTSNIDVFTAMRPKREWRNLPSTESIFPEFNLEDIKNEINLNVKQVIFCVSVSHEIQVYQARKLIKSNNIPIVQASVDKPDLEIIKSLEQLLSYSKSFHEMLQKIKQNYPNVKIIHLLFAGPPILAFMCGQQVSPTTDPELIVYNFSNRDNPAYGWGINLANEEIVDFRKKEGVRHG